MSDCQQCANYAPESASMVAHCTRYAAVVQPGDRPCEDFVLARPAFLSEPPASASPAPKPPTLPLLEAARKVDEHLTFAVSASGIIGRPGALRTPQQIFGDQMALRSAIGAEEEREKVRRAAAVLFQRDDRPENIVDLTPNPDGPSSLAIDVDAQLALREWAKMETYRAMAPTDDDATIRDQRDLLGRCATALEHLRYTVASGAAPLTPEAGLAHVKKLHAHIGLDPDVVGECLQVGAALRSAGVEPAQTDTCTCVIVDPFGSHESTCPVASVTPDEPAIVEGGPVMPKKGPPQ